MRPYQKQTLPSIRQLRLGAGALKAVRAPVLVVHGTKDRSAPYGAGREWALMLTDARLVSVAGAGHAPWVEAGRLVMEAMEMFLNGCWPDAAEAVTDLMPRAV